MKRRGFLGMLLGAPAVPVAAAMLEKLPKGFTRGLVESEPASADVGTGSVNGEAYDNYTSVVCPTVGGKRFNFKIRRYE